MLHMRLTGSVTALARCPEIRPFRVIRARRWVVAVVLTADMTADAVPVPLLHDLPVVFVRTDDFHIVEPLLPLNVPARRQHDDPALVGCGQVMLDTPAPQGVVDAVFLFLAGEDRFRDEVLAVADAQPVRAAAERDAALREVPFDGCGIGWLQHLAVPPAGPLVVNRRVAARARPRADVALG